jgi:protein SCO1/2
MKSLVAFLVIFIVGVAGGLYLLSDDKETLPIYNPVDVNPDLVDKSLQNKGLNHTVMDFYLQNQEGKWVDQNITKGKIVLANYFFATCPSICPLMNGKVAKVNEHFKNTKKLLILSHTVMPEVDSASVLLEYASRYDADVSTWQFLTGSKKHLYELARKSYLICPDENDPNYDHGSENDFIHTENVALIDRKGRIRGFYDATSDQQIVQLIKDIQILIDLEE